MGVAGPSETSPHFSQTARCHIPEDSVRCCGDGELSGLGHLA